ncbi:MAG TPA: hypothetical protein VF843_12025 [Streptosporangiaceae bacterium]
MRSIRSGRLLTGAAVLLTLAGAAGCGMTGQAGASGLARQVSNGERVGAATRAEAARQPAGPVQAAVPRTITGSQVVAIGDSVMAASAMALAKALPGIYIDAVPSREMPAGIAIVRRLAATGRLRRVLVMGLGTNYIVTTRQLSALLRLIGPSRTLVLVNTYVPDSWSKQVNATDAAFVRRHPQVVLADWYDTIRNRMYLLWPDHIHPLMPGTAVYARLIKRAVRAAGRGPGSAGASGVTASDLRPARSR